MITKVTIGKTFGGCVRYVVGKEGANVIGYGGVRGDEDVKLITQDFKTISQIQPTIKNTVWHTSISFAYQDEVNHRLMLDIANDYLTEMGLELNQYLIVEHTDRPHKHFHIVSNRIGFDGKVVSDSWCKNRSARVSDKIELKYGLTIATRVNRRLVDVSNSKLDAYSTLKLNAKQMIKDEVDRLITKGVSTLEELGHLLLQKNIELKIQNRNDGTVNGISFKTQEIALKGSSIHPDLRAKKLIKRLKDLGEKQSIKIGIGF